MTPEICLRLMLLKLIFVNSIDVSGGNEETDMVIFAIFQQNQQYISRNDFLITLPYFVSL